LTSVMTITCSPDLHSSEWTSCPQGAKVCLRQKEDALDCCLGSSCWCQNHSFHMGFAGFKRPQRGKALIYVKSFLSCCVALQLKLRYSLEEQPLFYNDSRVDGIAVFCVPGIKRSTDVDYLTHASFRLGTLPFYSGLAWITRRCQPPSQGAEGVAQASVCLAPPLLLHSTDPQPGLRNGHSSARLKGKVSLPPNS
jgi:hypothetical protein